MVIDLLIFINEFVNSINNPVSINNPSTIKMLTLALCSLGLLVTPVPFVGPALASAPLVGTTMLATADPLVGGDPLVNSIALAAMVSVFAFQNYQMGQASVAAAGPHSGPNAIWALPDDDDDDQVRSSQRSSNDATCPLHPAQPTRAPGTHTAQCYMLGKEASGGTVCTSAPVGYGECELDEDFSEYYQTGIWRCDE